MASGASLLAEQAAELEQADLAVPAAALLAPALPPAVAAGQLLPLSG